MYQISKQQWLSLQTLECWTPSPSLTFFFNPTKIGTINTLGTLQTEVGYMGGFVQGVVVTKGVIGQLLLRMVSKILGLLPCSTVLWGT